MSTDNPYEVNYTLFKDSKLGTNDVEFYLDGSAAKDPLRPFRFLVTLQAGTTEVPFMGVTKISGLKWKTGTFKYYDGGGMTPRVIPTRPEYEPIVFTRAVFAEDGVWEWCKRVFNLRLGAGVPSFKVLQMNIYQLSYYYDETSSDSSGAKFIEGDIERAWKVVNSWPSEYDMGELDRESDGISLATITLEHEGCVVDDVLMEKNWKSQVGANLISTFTPTGV